MSRNSRRTRGGGARCGVWARGKESNTAWIGIAQAEAATDGGCATRARRQRSSNPPFQIPHPAPLRLAMTQQGRVCRTARLALVVCRSRQLPQHQARLLLEVSLPITCLPCVPRCSPLPRRALCLPNSHPCPGVPCLSCLDANSCAERKGIDTKDSTTANPNLPQIIAFLIQSAWTLFLCLRAQIPSKPPPTYLLAPQRCAINFPQLTPMAHPSFFKQFKILDL